MLCLGVDGGGTSTSCVALDADSGEVLGRGSAGCSNKNSVGVAQSNTALRQAIDAALAAAGSDASSVAAVCCGVSGCDTEADAAELEAVLRPWFSSNTQLRVYNDAVAALCSGTQGTLDGCVIIAGTGTVAFGARPNGHTARAAGWGGAFLDGGSGYDVGQRAMAAVARALDGRGPPTSLLSAVCDRCGVPPGVADPMGELLRWAYGEPAGSNGGWARTAALAEDVAACAARGDGVAGAILDAAAAELVGSLQAVCRRLSLPPTAAQEQQQQEEESRFTVVLAGGMLQSESQLSVRVVRLCEQLLPAAMVVHAGDPAQGAALLARRQHLEQRQGSGGAAGEA